MGDEYMWQLSGDDSPKRDSGEKHEKSETESASAWNFNSMFGNFKQMSSNAVNVLSRDLHEFADTFGKDVKDAGQKIEKSALGVMEGKDTRECAQDEQGDAQRTGGGQVTAFTENSAVKSVSSMFGRLGSELSHWSEKITEEFNKSVGLDDEPSQSKEGAEQPSVKAIDIKLEQLRTDSATYLKEPENAEDFKKWKLAVDGEELARDIEDALNNDQVVCEKYQSLVPQSVKAEDFWDRYFYCVDRIASAEKERLKTLGEAELCQDEDEEVPWDDENSPRDDESEDAQKRDPDKQAVEKDSPPFSSGKPASPVFPADTQSMSSQGDNESHDSAGGVKVASTLKRATSEESWVGVECEEGSSGQDEDADSEKARMETKREPSGSVDEEGWSSWE